MIWMYLVMGQCRRTNLLKSRSGNLVDTRIGIEALKIAKFSSGGWVGRKLFVWEIVWAWAEKVANRNTYDK